MFWGCVSGVKGHHAKLSLAADAESVSEIRAVIWTPAFRSDDGVPLMAQPAEQERERESFKVGWNSDLRHHYSSPFIACIVILINSSLLYILYALLKILFAAAVFPHLLSYVIIHPLPHCLSRRLYLHAPILFCILLLLFYAHQHSQGHIPFRFWL